MDPKGDRLRKIQSGQLKLPESVLKSNNIVLTTDKPSVGGGGCLEGGPRPRPAAREDQAGLTTSRTPIIIPIKGGNNKMTLSTAEIPLPSNSDIPLPEAGDIPLPSTDMVNIPLPSGILPSNKHEDIPLPSNDSIPLPAERQAVSQTAPQTERRRIKVSLSHLEPKGDELLCRSCVMRFAKQIDYDTHLQSDAHQQVWFFDGISKAIKQSDIQSHGASLLTKRLDKSPSHDNKSGHVSFSFKKNYGSRIVNTQPFIPVRREEKRSSPVEIKLLKPEIEVNDVVDGGTEKTENGSTAGSLEGSERDECKSEREEEKGPENKLFMEDFVKVQSKDDTGRVLDWPKEMVQYTKTEPKLMFSCNPLSFDFSQLFSVKKKSPGHAGTGTSNATIETEFEHKAAVENDQKTEDSQKADTEKKKSHKKKKKKHKHKKHKDKSEVKEADDDEIKKVGDENKKGGEETSSSSKKKKKKHKRKHEDKENDTSKENIDNAEVGDEKEKKKHKKSKKKSKQSDEEGEKGDEDERKHKKKKKKKSKKRKKSKHHGDSDNEKTDIEKESKDKEKCESGASGKESENEKKDKDSKKKKKKRKKHKRKENGKDESSESETEKVDTLKTEVLEKSDVAAPVKRKFPEGDSDGESDKIVAKLQALSRTKVVPKTSVVNNQVLQKKIKKEPVDTIEKKTPSDRKRMNSESSVNESSTPIKKTRVTPKASGVKDNIHIAAVAQIANVKVEKEESWSKIETQTTDNVKSKWDTSDSDMDNALDATLKKEKVLRKRASTRGGVNKTNILKELKSPSSKNSAKIENEQKKILNQSSSQRSNKSNISAGSAKLLNSVSDKHVRKSRKVSRSPASSHSRSRSRSHNRHRSYSHSGSSSRSRSRSYSSSSYYSDDSRHSRHRRRRSSSRSYSRSSSRSRSRSYRRRRGRSSSYSDYSRSRSYSSSRSRSRSHRRRKRSYTRSRSRSYSSSSYSSRSRSRTRSYRKSRRKNRRKKTFSKDRSLSVPPQVEKEILAKKKTEKEEKVKEVKEKVDPSEIPLPDLSGKKDDERTEEKLQKLKEKKRRTDVGETVAKLVESLPADIPLPFSEGASRTVSSDSLPSGPPTEAPKETDSGFIGPKMPGPPPPPPNMGRGFPPNHGPPGPPRPGYMHGQWDHWDAHGPWDAPGPWDGPRPPFRGMRPPYDPRMYGPYDPRRRGPPPHYMNRPRGPHPYMGPRYPGPPGPHPDYGYEYGEYDYAEDDTSKSSSPPPLPKDPPKESSPKPPLPKKKGKDQTEPEQNPDIVIPPEQAEQYKHLQKQAAKHARRQLRRQAKKELGEPDEDSTSSESEPEEQPEEVVEETVADETQTQLVAVPQQVVLQPQPAGSPSGAYIIVSGGQQYIVQKPHIVQAGMPMQAGQPVMAVSQGAIMATAAAAAHGAHPAHIVQQVPVGHQILAAPTHQISAGVPVQLASAASIQHLQQMQQLQQLQQIQQIQQIQQAQAIQAHNQAVAAAAVQQGPIVVGNRILVPTLGVRPAM